MSNERIAEQVLNKHLREDEVVQWEGVTAPFALLEKDAKNKILSTWIGAVVVGAAFLAIYLRGNGDASGVKTIIVVAAIVAAICLMSIYQRRALLKQMYWITNQRAILMTGDKAVFSMELEYLDGYQILSGKTPHGTLVLGSKLFEEGDKQMRWRGCHPLMDNTGASGSSAAEGLLFFNVENLKEAEPYLEQWAVKKN